MVGPRLPVRSRFAPRASICAIVRLQYAAMPPSRPEWAHPTTRVFHHRQTGQDRNLLTRLPAQYGPLAVPGVTLLWSPYWAKGLLTTQTFRAVNRGRALISGQFSSNERLCQHLSMCVDMIPSHHLTRRRNSNCHKFLLRCHPDGRRNHAEYLHLQGLSAFRGTGRDKVCDHRTA